MLECGVGAENKEEVAVIEEEKIDFEKVGVETGDIPTAE